MLIHTRQLAVKRMLVNAVEESARFSKRNPMPKVESHDLTREELIEIFGEPSK